MTNLSELKKDIKLLSQDDWDEIDLEVKIVGEIINTHRDKSVTGLFND